MVRGARRGGTRQPEVPGECGTQPLRGDRLVPATRVMPETGAGPAGPQHGRGRRSGGGTPHGHPRMPGGCWEQGDLGRWLQSGVAFLSRQRGTRPGYNRRIPAALPIAPPALHPSSAPGASPGRGACRTPPGPYLRPHGAPPSPAAGSGPGARAGGRAAGSCSPGGGGRTTLPSTARPGGGGAGPRSCACILPPGHGSPGSRCTPAPGRHPRAGQQHPLHPAPPAALPRAGLPRLAWPPRRDPARSRAAATPTRCTAAFGQAAKPAPRVSVMGRWTRHPLPLHTVRIPAATAAPGPRAVTPRTCATSSVACTVARCLE